MILLAMQLLKGDEKEQLKEMIFDIEKMVLETEMVPQEREDGSIVWVERVKGRLSLYDIEMSIESNPDFFAYFEKEDGTIITKFDVERKLNELKMWIFDRVYEKSENRRFSKLR